MNIISTALIIILSSSAVFALDLSHLDNDFKEEVNKKIKNEKNLKIKKEEYRLISQKENRDNIIKKRDKLIEQRKSILFKTSREKKVDEKERLEREEIAKLIKMYRYTPPTKEKRKGKKFKSTQHIDENGNLVFIIKE